VLQRVAACCAKSEEALVLEMQATLKEEQCVAVCCSVLQRVAACCQEWRGTLLEMQATLKEVQQE